MVVEPAGEITGLECFATGGGDVAVGISASPSPATLLCGGGGGTKTSLPPADGRALPVRGGTGGFLKSQFVFAVGVELYRSFVFCSEEVTEEEVFEARALSSANVGMVVDE